MDLNFAKYLLEKTRDTYDLIAKDFSGKREKIWEEMLFLFDDLKEGERVLDLGCGNGRWFPVFREKKVEYFGVDFSKKLVQIAKEKFPESNFLVADALNLPFPENFFDKIYSIAVLHHIPSEIFRIKFLKEAKRVLKKEGKLILTVWKIHQLREQLLFFKYTFLKLIGKSRLDFKDVFKPWGKRAKRYCHFFSQRELKNLLEKADFKILKIGLVKNKKGNRQNYFAICQKP